jgi:hypothetical protein
MAEEGVLRSATETLREAVMPDRTSEASERARLLEKAVSRWENEGGTVAGAPSNMSSEEAMPDAPSASRAEYGRLQVRVIALENLVTVLLAASSDAQLELAREMAATIAPRAGSTPHRLTVDAATRMLGLVRSAGHLRSLCSAGATGDEPAGVGSTG